MNPQQMFEAAVQLDGEIVQLAFQMAKMSRRDCADVAARIAVAAEGIERLYSQVLAETSGELPFREDFEALRDLCKSRTRALQELVLRGDFSTSGVMTINGVVDTTSEPLRNLIEKLQGLAAAAGVHAFILWLVGTFVEVEVEVGVDPEDQERAVRKMWKNTMYGRIGEPER